MTQSQSPPEIVRLRMELSDGTYVDVSSGQSMTAETCAELLEYLDVYRDVLRKRAQQEQARSEATCDPLA